jgi:prephenate dehydratase
MIHSMHNDLRDVRVAIQGSQASFHHVAAMGYFGSKAEMIYCHSFKESCEALVANRADYTVIAAGNSIAGNILANYEMVLQYGFSVIGEVYCPIALHLMALKETNAEEIHSIRSHPMALLQCADFLSAMPQIEVIAAGDTASCAREITTRNMTHTAVIAGYETAKCYGLRILNENIHAQTHNYTRFWILSKGDTLPDESNKASLSFMLKDRAGSLAEALFCFRSEGLNLASIQSLPPSRDRGSYRFYADVEYSHRNKFLRCISALQMKCNELKIMGEYRRDLNPDLKLNAFKI